MLKTVIKKELRENLYSHRFLVFFVLTPLLISISMLFLVQKYKSRISDYELAVKENSTQQRNIVTYSGLAMKVIKRPNPLSVFHEGLERNIGDLFTLSLSRLPTLENAGRMTVENPFMVEFYGFDFTAVFILLMSIMAIYWGHNTVSGEKENGTLGLILSHPVPRFKLMLGKSIGGMISLLIPVLTGFLAASLIIVLAGTGGLYPAQWVLTLLLFLVLTLFILLCYLMAVLFSNLTRKSSVSLLYAMLFWIVFILLIPAIVPYIVDLIHPVPTGQKVESQVSLFKEEFLKKVKEYEESFENIHFQVDIRANFIPGNNLYSLFNNNLQVETTHQPTLDYMKNFIKYIEPLRLSYIEKIEKLVNARMRLLKSQRNLYENLSRVSPAYLLSHTAAQLCGTGANTYISLLDSLRLYRYQVIEELKRKNAFASYDYFTSQFSKRDADSNLVSEFPLFNEPVLSIEDRFNAGLPDLIILLLEIAMIFLLSLSLFLRYDPR
jgi:ABC-type transport system involved in multi-copper enzyme maturation permease subunit